MNERSAGEDPSGDTPGPLTSGASHDAIVELIYEAATDATRWSEVAAALSRAVGGHMVVVWLRLPGESSRQEVYRSDASSVPSEILMEMWSRVIPWGNKLPPLGSGRDSLHRFADLGVMYPESELSETEYYRRWLAPRGAAPRSPFAHVVAEQDDVPRMVVALTQRSGLPPIGPAELAIADRLVPHFRRAYTTLNQLRSMRREQDVFREVIDRLPTGVVLLDDSGRVVALNEAARLLVESGEGVRIEEGRLVVDGPEENRWLQGAIEKAIHAGSRDALDPDLIFEARRSGAGGQIPMLVMPLLAPASDSTLPDTAAMIFLGGPKLAYVTATHLLRNLYELTRAEADLTWLLADGLSLEEAAERRGVTLNTARSQLKRVFAKTGVRRQSELVRIVLGGVGAMRGPE